MTTRSLGFVVAAAWAAAAIALPLPVDAAFVASVAAVAALAGWRLDRQWLVAGALIVLIAGRAAGSWVASEVSLPPSAWSGTLTLATDPESRPGGVAFRADVDGALHDLRAWGSPAGHLRPRLMGERITVEITRRPLGDAPAWIRAQGVTGRATVLQVSGHDVGSPSTRIANSLRRTIESGGSPIARDSRGLYTGLVFGDDRRLDPLAADDFAGAGLTHLIAVSGQNVAFVLAIVGPAIRRLRPRLRLVPVLGVLLIFATMTRFEASVLRASVMAAVAAVATFVGISITPVRTLLLTVLGLLILEPLIVHRVGFQLSVAASAGIVLWSGRLARSVPGPRPLINALAVTTTAQLAVAPLLLWRFGGLPVASFPANILVGPVAGLVMMWGMTAGLVAGLWSSLATVIHVPTRLMLWWIESVAAWSTAANLGELGTIELAILTVGVAIAMYLRRPVMQLVAGCFVACGLSLAVAGGPPRPSFAIGDVASLAVSGDHRVLVLSSGRDPGEVLEQLRRARVGTLDLVVAERSSFAMADLISWLDDRHGVEAVWAPEATMGVGEDVPSRDHSLQLNGRVFRPTIVEGRLRLDEVR